MTEPSGPPWGVRLVVAYDGTDFCGYQIQDGDRTVQQVLLTAIEVMNGQAVEKLRGASRTDSGVHAEGQVVAFDAVRDISDFGWFRGLNGELPDDVAVRSAERVAPGYNPRYDSLGKYYRYLVQVGRARDPLMRHRAWYLHPGMSAPDRPRGAEVDGWLDLDAMADAAAAMLGKHDFSAFKASNDARENAVRTLHAVELEPGYTGRPDLLAIHVRGDAFVKNMVRIMAGTLVEVGRGRMTAQQVANALASGERDQAGPTAPPQGLTLVEISLGRGPRGASR